MTLTRPRTQPVLGVPMLLLACGLFAVNGTIAKVTMRAGRTAALRDQPTLTAPDLVAATSGRNEGPPRGVT